MTTYTLTIKFPAFISNSVVGLISALAQAGRVLEIPRKAGEDWRGVTVSYQEGQEGLCRQFETELRRILNPRLITVERTEVRTAEDPWAEYERLLAAHDWYHDMSDDHRVWEAGRASLERITFLRGRLNAVGAERAEALWRKYAKA